MVGIKQYQKLMILEAYMFGSGLADIRDQSDFSNLIWKSMCHGFSAWNFFTSRVAKVASSDIKLFASEFLFTFKHWNNGKIYSIVWH